MSAEPDKAAPAESAPAGMEVDPWTDRLGGLVERYPRLWVRFGDMETRFLRETLQEVSVERPVYVAGLARSGSTILLELLARHRDTATHRYRDFPLVFTPWAWNWFVDRAGKKEHEATERAHRDRIAVTPESPEAFEEVLWMAFFPGLHDPLLNAVLNGGTQSPRFEAFYRDHIRKLLLIRGGTRYLAKGNYNVTRLGYLKRLFKDARFVVPVRDPLWHIASLMKQHALFCREEARDPRVLDHMRRAGHFEFGLDRRVVNAGDPEAAARVMQLWDEGRELAGWAEYWNMVYGHVQAALAADPALREATLVVRYEDLCARPGDMLRRVLDHCGLAHDGLPEVAEGMISPPAYYRPSFTPQEEEEILVRCGATARAYGYPDKAGAAAAASRQRDRANTP